MMTAPPTPAAAPAVLFDAVLHPHRSLPPRGFAILMGVLGGVSLAVGTAFVVSGAWPVMGFFGLDVLIVYIAFRINYRAAELYETVRLTERHLIVWRIDPRHPPRSWTFEPTWLRVAMDDPPEHDSQIILSSHGRSLIVGSFLTPEERLDFANALRTALHRWRQRRV